VNTGIAFILLGVILLAMDIFYKISARKCITLSAVIVGYKQFPTDKIIPHNDITLDFHIYWLRMVEFINPKTGKKLTMFSNPATWSPEQIGTTIKIDFNPNKIDPIKDYVWVHDGYAFNRDMGKTSLFTGFAFFLLFLLWPTQSPVVHVTSLLIAFAILFSRSALVSRRRKQ